MNNVVFVVVVDDDAKIASVKRRLYVSYLIKISEQFQKKMDPGIMTEGWLLNGSQTVRRRIAKTRKKVPNTHKGTVPFYFACKDSIPTVPEVVIQLIVEHLISQPK